MTVSAEMFAEATNELRAVRAERDALDAAQPTDDARDAARYRWLRTFAERQNGYWKINVNLHAADNIDAAIDAAIASQGAKGAAPSARHQRRARTKC